MPDELYPVLKTCRTCRETKPLDDFHRKANSKDGRSGECKPCTQAYKVRRYAADPDYFRRYYAENRERVIAQRKEYRQANRPTVAAREKRYRLQNSEKVAAREREYRQRNHERISDQRRSYLQRPEVKERAMETLHRWRAENKDRWLASKKDWERRNPEKVRAVRLVHNHKQRGAEGTFTAAEWDELCSQYENRCLCCRADDIALTVDHVVPICKGGKNVIANLQPLCAPCNIRKRCQIIDYRPLQQAPLF